MFPTPQDVIRVPYHAEDRRKISDPMKQQEEKERMEERKN
jgi:hypothetical protein